MAQGYKAVKERSAVARFKCVGEDAYFLAWTTTPWTLPSNVALCVNPDESYVKVKAADGYTYYMAQALLDTVLGGLAEEGKPAYEILETYKGTDLEYREYEPLFACAGEEAARQGKKAHYVTCDNYVTMSDGTGIVHIAPAFGEDDANVGRKYGLPLVQFVDGKGHMTQETPYAGKFVKDADPDILKDLDKEGKLFSAPKFEHDYPFCWRCDTPPIYYARESWSDQDDRGEGRPGAQQQDHQLDPAHHRRGALRQLAGEHPGLGHLQEPLLGHALKYLGVRMRAHGIRGKPPGAGGPHRG